MCLRIPGAGLRLVLRPVPDGLPRGAASLLDERGTDGIPLSLREARPDRGERISVNNLHVSNISHIFAHYRAIVKGFDGAINCNNRYIRRQSKAIYCNIANISAIIFEIYYK